MCLITARFLSTPWNVTRCQWHDWLQGMGWCWISCHHILPHSYCSGTTAPMPQGNIKLPDSKEHTSLFSSPIFIFLMLYSNCFHQFFFLRVDSVLLEKIYLIYLLIPVLTGGLKQWNLRKCWLTQCRLQIPWANCMISSYDNQKAFKAWIFI